MPWERPWHKRKSCQQNSWRSRFGFWRLGLDELGDFFLLVFWSVQRKDDIFVDSGLACCGNPMCICHFLDNVPTVICTYIYLKRYFNLMTLLCFRSNSWTITKFPVNFQQRWVVRCTPSTVKSKLHRFMDVHHMWWFWTGLTQLQESEVSVCFIITIHSIHETGRFPCILL